MFLIKMMMILGNDDLYFAEKQRSEDPGFLSKGLTSFVESMAITQN